MSGWSSFLLLVLIISLFRNVVRILLLAATFHNITAQEPVENDSGVIYIYIRLETGTGVHHVFLFCCLFVCLFVLSCFCFFICLLACLFVFVLLFFVCLFVFSKSPDLAVFYNETKIDR